MALEYRFSECREPFCLNEDGFDRLSEGC